MVYTQTIYFIMKDVKIEILDLDFEYKLWKNKLQFYQKEIVLIKHRIESLKKEHPNFTLKTIYGKTLIEQRKNIELVKTKIRTMEQEMGYYAVDYPILKRHTHYIEHEKIRLEMESVIKTQQLISDQIFPILCYPLNL